MGYDNFLILRWRGRRRWRGTDAAGRVDHDIDYPLADTGIFKIEDLRGAQVVDRTRITNLADDDLIANTGFCQGLDVCCSQWLALVDPYQCLRGILTHPFPLLLIDGIADDGAGERPNRATN